MTRDEATDVLVGLVHAIDRRDWAGVRAAFTERLTVDYSSLFGGDPEELAADDLLSRWQGLLPGFDATQHVLGPVEVGHGSDPMRADVHVRAHHYLDGADGGPEWMVAGHYVARLAEQDGVWRLASLTLETYRQEGNTRLPELATARVG